MTTFRSTLIIVFSTILTALSCCGCADRNASGKSLLNDSIADQLALVRQALIGHDLTNIASQFDYPVFRPYPLKDIADSAEMIEYLPVMIDDSLRNIISDISPDDWIAMGWRGWSPTDDGSILLWDGSIYAFNYMSAVEASNKRLLEREEIESLHPALREGWQPYYCMIATDNGTIFRIDISDTVSKETDGTSVMRIMAYDSRSDLSGMPSINLTGTLILEGSEGNRVLRFESDGNTIEFNMDPSDESRPEIEVTFQGKTSRHPVESIYWRDCISEGNNAE